MLVALTLSACGGAASTGSASSAKSGAAHAGSATTTTAATGTGRTTAAAAPARRRPVPLPKPARLRPFTHAAPPGQGIWHPAGRRVSGIPAVYETTIVPSGGTQPAGIAWMDTRLLAARLYSGSESPGGGPYRYTAPVQPGAARRLVAAFNGGFKMSSAEGGYFTEGRMIAPLRAGAASLVIYAGGAVDVGAWGRDVSMTRNVVAVRQNLVPLVAGGRPTPLAASANWQIWGATCGSTSCSAGVPGVEYQWRSAVGVTRNRALVYVQGPSLSPLQLAQLLVRARVVRGMELDINPDWPIFATYRPPTPNGLAAAANGHGLLPGTVRGPDTFFDAWWARDFITMSARRLHTR